MLYIAEEFNITQKEKIGLLEFSKDFKSKIFQLNYLYYI